MENKETKTLVIEGVVGYKMTITKDGYDVNYDVTNENDLLYLIGTENVLEEIENAVKLKNVYSMKEKKDKRDKLNEIRKLKIQCKKCITDLINYFLDTKDQAHYDLISDKIHGRKSKIVTATEADIKKLNLIKP